MNPTQAKIHKTSKIISVILKCSMILVCIAALLLAGATLVLTFADQATKTSLLNAFTVTPPSAILLTYNNLLILLITCIMYVVLIFVTLLLIYRIFRDIAKNFTPFDPKHILRLKLIAVMVIGMSFTDNMVAFFFTTQVSGSSFTYSFDIVGVFIGVIIYFLAYIFDYGCQLQIQSDETL